VGYRELGDEERAENRAGAISWRYGAEQSWSNKTGQAKLVKQNWSNRNWSNKTG